jgi:hypothetical protein
VVVAVPLEDKMAEQRAASCLAGLLALAAPALPGAFHRLPANVRERATVVVSGVYTVARGPDEPLPGGRTRWPLLQGFLVKTVYRGEVAAEYIGVETVHPLRRWGRLALVEGREYLIVLRPSRESRRILAVRERSWDWRKALAKDEILAIVVP